MKIKRYKSEADTLKYMYKFVAAERRNVANYNKVSQSIITEIIMIATQTYT